MDDFGDGKSQLSDSSDNNEAQNGLHIEVNTPSDNITENAESQPVIQDVIKPPVQDIIPVEPTAVSEQTFDDSMELGPELIDPTSEPISPVGPVVPEIPVVQEASAVQETPVAAPASAPIAPVAAATATQPFNQTPISINGEVKPQDIKKTHKNSLKLALLISFGLLLFLIGGIYLLVFKL